MATLETQYKNFKINNPDSTFTFEEWKEYFGKKLEKSMKRLEMEKIIDESYDAYQNHFLGYEDIPNRELFLLQCKVDKTFSERWGLNVEEKMLNHQERSDLKNSPPYLYGKPQNGRLIDERLLDSNNVPKKLITVSYNNKTAECYE